VALQKMRTSRGRGGRHGGSVTWRGPGENGCRGGMAESRSRRLRRLARGAAQRGTRARRGPLSGDRRYRPARAAIRLTSRRRLMVYVPAATAFAVPWQPPGVVVSGGKVVIGTGL
jgi:hypothetical protein